ncbi:unnamed protein product, partial [marine sediment metagenome]
MVSEIVPGSSLAKGKSNLPCGDNVEEPILPVNLNPVFEGSESFYNGWFTFGDIMPYLWRHWVNWRSEWTINGMDLLPWLSKDNSGRFDMPMSDLWDYSGPKWFANF